MHPFERFRKLKNSINITLCSFFQVGSTVTGLLEDLLVRLRVRCDVISVTSGPGTTLKHALLSLVARLLEPQGAISLAMGPLDAQCCLLGTLLSMHYDGLDRMHVPLTIISSTGGCLGMAVEGSGQ